MYISVFTVAQALGAGNRDSYSDYEEKDLSGSSTVACVHSSLEQVQKWSDVGT